MNDAAEWIALCYSVPASPSKARVFVWRRLRALGAVTLRPGLAALPNTPRGVREFTSLAGRITELGGESLLLTMDLVDAGEGERLRERFAAEDRRAWQKALDQAAPLLEALRTAPPAERAQLEADARALSDGQNKKALLALSLCERAHLYVWDEPLNYVDALSRVQIENLILQSQPTLVFVEHDAAFVRRVATRAVQLEP